MVGGRNCKVTLMWLAKEEIRRGIQLASDTKGTQITVKAPNNEADGPCLVRLRYDKLLGGCTPLTILALAPTADAMEIAGTHGGSSCHMILSCCSRIGK